MDDAGLTGVGSGLGGTAAVAASADLAGLAAGGGHGGHAGHGASGHCLNCNTALTPGARFCSQCGQDTANHPPSLFEFVHEFVSHYIAVEGTLWKSLWGLLARPGFLTREYLAGRKQRYVLPLRLLLTLGLIFFLALKFVPSSTESLGLEHELEADTAAEPAEAGSAASGVAAKLAKAQKKLDSRLGAVQDTATKNSEFTLISPEITAHMPPAMQARVHRAEAHWREDSKGAVRAMGATMLGLAPYAVLCSLPFFAGLLKLLFWRQPYGAHFVFAMHLHAAWYAMLLLAVLMPWSVVAFALWVWSNLYPVLALKRVHEAGWGTTLLRAGLLAVLHWVIIGLGVTSLALVGALAAA